MLTIVRIRKGKRNFYEIELSNNETIRVSEDLLVRFRLLKGRELTKEEVAEIKKSGGFDVGLQLALNYVSFQLRTEKEVGKMLKEKEISASDSKLVIAHLRKLNVLDDKSYSESYLRTQIRLSDKGPSVLAQQLREKGVKEEVIQESLPLYTMDQQIEVATHAADKVLRRLQSKSHKEMLQKLKLHLMQKGFSQEIIQQVLTELSLEKDTEQEQDALQKEGQKLLRRHQRLPLKKRQQKVKQGLYQKGFDFDLIQQFLDEECLDD